MSNPHTISAAPIAAAELEGCWNCNRRDARLDSIFCSDDCEKSFQEM
jgi:hypothetical protein